jgi:penicillin G amidase
MRWIGRLILLIVILVAGVALWLVPTVPGPDTTLRLAGLTAPVTIERDRYGIPTVAAANDRDAAFALGYLHAQNRLFQMDLMRRDGAGRLSEWFGAAALPTDEFMRTLGIYRVAQAEYQTMTPEGRAIVDAYTAGVNAWLETRDVALPPAYYLLGVRPEPWRPADTLVWGKLMALELCGNFRDELLRAAMSRHLTPADLAVLYPAYPEHAPTAWGETAARRRGMPLDAIYAAIPAVVGPIFDSNNWVVDGRHTASGKPMLANDPHLALDAPGMWYLAHIKTPDLDVTGVTAPGDPYVVIGHNAHIAWGFTNTGGDVEDLFVEKVDPKDPRRYLTPNGSEPFFTRQETIRVRGGKTVTITVRATRHGPVISDLGGKYVAAGAGTVLALEATWLMPGDHSPEALRLIDRATNWTEFRDAVKQFTAPEQNMVFADTAGNIGYIAPALVPIRGKGDGWLPAPGWSGDYDWKGFIPFDQLPQAYDPPGGRFVTANQKIVPDSYPYFITRDWDIPNRAERINRLIDAKAKLTPDDFAAIQADTVSLMARHLVPMMTDIAPRTARDKRAIKLLDEWNFHMNRDLVAPLIFVAWLRELERELFQAKLGNEFAAYWRARPQVVRGILTTHRDWCLPRGAEPGDCGAVLAQSLHVALDQLAAHFGDENVDDWRWGRVHVAPFANPFWSRVPEIGGWFALDIPTDGGSDTVNRGEMRYDDANPYADIEGPGLRMIVDLSNPADARFLITPGQGGGPLSPHYADLALRWRDFDYLTLGSPRQYAVLRLLPESSGKPEK